MRKRKLEKHKKGRVMSPALIHALDHPLRRQALRVMNEQEKAQSPVDLTRFIATPLSNLSYHTKVLRELGVIRQTRIEHVRGSTKHFYVSQVADNAQVVSILAETQKDDKELDKKQR